MMKSSPEARAGAKVSGVSREEVFFVNEKNHGWVLEAVKRNSEQSPSRTDNFSSSFVGTVSRSKNQYSYKLQQELDLEPPLKRSEIHPNPNPTQQQPITPRGSHPKPSASSTSNPNLNPNPSPSDDSSREGSALENVDHVLNDAELMERPSLWRMRERMKTVSVALVLCMNLGTDPPDVVKTSPCARMECWMDSSELQADNALHVLARNLTKQFERWQPRARYKHVLDPTRDSVKKLCTSLRRSARRERVLFHYNGHGVPRPTPNGEVWVFNSSYTQYIPLSVYDLIAWTGYPAIYTFDCSGAGLILKHFVQSTMAVPEGGETVGSRKAIGSEEKTAAQECIVLAACSANEQLPSSPDFPADVFTSCLTTPIRMALRWFVMQNRTSMNAIGIKPEMVDHIPGRPNDRKTPLGELNWVFTAITDTIAWNVLPRYLFQRLFRQDLLVASLFRNFLLAERILKSVGCTPLTHPELPSTWQHPMWQAWDMAAENCLSQLPLMTPWLFVDQKREKQLVIPDQTVTANEDVNLSSSLPGASSYYGAANPNKLGELLGKNNTMFAEPATAALSKQTSKLFGQHSKDSGSVGMSNGSRLKPPEQGAVPSGFVYRNTDYFTHQLTAFEVWLSFADNIEARAVPEQLPIVLQVLLSQAHRARALDLLANFLDLGLWAVSLALNVGIFPYVNKLLNSPANELKPVLIFIWCKILALDRSCQKDLVKDQPANDTAKADGGFKYFITQLIDAQPPALMNTTPEACICKIYHNVRAAFALSVILDRHPLGQKACLENDLLEVIRPYMSSSLNKTLRSKFLEEGRTDESLKRLYCALAQLKRWLCLCLAKLWQDCGAAKRAAFKAKIHLLLYDLAHANENTDVRQAAIYSLGLLLGSTASTPQALGGVSREEFGDEEDEEKDCVIVAKLLDSRKDGSVAVRRELVLALARFVVDDRHATPIQVTAHEMGQEKLRLRRKSVQSSRSSGSALEREADPWLFTDEVFERLQEKLERMLQSNARCYFDTWGCVRQLHEQDPFPAVSMAAGRLVQFVSAGVSKRIEAINERAGVSESMNKPRVVQKTGGSISVSFSHLQAKQLQRAMLTKRHQPLASQRRRPTERARPAPIVPTVEQLRKISLVSLLYAKARKEFMRPTPAHENGPWSRRNAAALPDPLGATGVQLLTWRQRNAEKAKAARLLRKEGKKWACLNESTPSPLRSPMSRRRSPTAERRGRKQPVPKPDKLTKRRLVKLSGKVSSIPIMHKEDCNICGRPSVGLREETSTEFEEFAAIENDSLELCSIILFHPYELFIVACNQKDMLTVWSFGKDRARKVKTVLNAEIDEYFHQDAEFDDMDKDKDKDKGGWFGSTSATKPTRSMSRPAASRSRVTDMKWINETAEPFLVVASDDGIARVWRNILPAPDRVSEGKRQALGLQERLVSAWVALDVPDSPIGSSTRMVIDWHQRTGQLLCAGPASYMSIWDVQMEVELERINVDSSSSVTSVASYCQQFGNGGRGVDPSIDFGTGGYAAGGANTVFACGGSDGSVRFFDRRVHRVQEVLKTGNAANLITTSLEHDSWIASLAIPQRTDGRELVSCSGNGVVKTWDLRCLDSAVESKSKRTFELNCSPVTAFAAHEYAPIFAAGSSNQSVQVVNSNGISLSEMRYRDSFLRGKSRPVSCLSFHPYKLLLAAGTTDYFASMYAPI